MTATPTAQSSERRDGGAPARRDAAGVEERRRRRGDRRGGHGRARDRGPARPRQQRAAAARPACARGRRGARRRDPVAPGLAELDRDARRRVTNGDPATFDARRRSDRGGPAAVRLGRRCGGVGARRELPARAARRQGLRARDAAGGRVAEVFGRAPRAGRRGEAPSTFAVVDLLGGPRRRLGYAYAGPVPPPRYVVYGERTLARDRKAQRRQGLRVLRPRLRAVRRHEAGRRPSSSRRAPVAPASAAGPGRRPRAVRRHAAPARHLAPRTSSAARCWPGCPGSSARSACCAPRPPRSRCGGSRSGAARPSGSRSRTSGCTPISAASPRRCSTASCPQTLPEAHGLEFGAIYAPGTEGIDIGGDWYEVVARADGTVVVVVGDVSGHGLDAATMMASLRFAIRAYAADGDGPGSILGKLTHLVNVGRDGHFATVLCGVVDPGAHRPRWADAGHPRPLVVADGTSRYVSVPGGSAGRGGRGRRVRRGRARRCPPTARCCSTPTGSSSGGARRSTSASTDSPTRRAGSRTSRSRTRCSRSCGGRSPTGATTTPRSSASAGARGDAAEPHRTFPGRPTR